MATMSFWDPLGFTKTDLPRPKRSLVEHRPHTMTKAGTAIFVRLSQNAQVGHIVACHPAVGNIFSHL